MTLAEPAWLLGLPLTLLLGGVLAMAGWLHRQRLRTVVSEHLLQLVLPPSVRARRVIRDLSATLGLGLALVALAEPRFNKQLQTIKTRGTDLVVLLDLSRSMDAQDVDPSRLERARREIRDLGRLAEGDRVGLVVFAGGAYPRLPLTQDFHALDLVISETDTSTFDSQGSALGQAIRAGAELLRRSQDKAGQALIVLSDGETHDPEDARAAAEEALAAGIPIYAMGIGIEAATIPLPTGRSMQYNGRLVTTTPDFTTLEEVARLTGGAFVQSTASDRDMQGLYSEIRGAVRAAERSTQQRETWRTAYHWPLAAALALLLLAGWLGEGSRRWGAAVAVVLALLALPPAAQAGPLEDADKAYRSEEFGDAVRQLTELSLERPDDPEVFDRLGAARYRSEDWEGAARAFDQAARLRGDDPDALFNAGNAHYRAGRLERAVERYQSALERDPDHPSAQQNMGLVQREIELRRQQQPPPPPPPPEPESSDEESEPDDGDGEAPEQPSSDETGESPQSEDSSESQQNPQPGEPQGEPSGSQPGTPQPKGSSGTDPSGEDQPSEAVGAEELDGQPAEEEEGIAQGGGGTDQETGPITAGQAHRLLDAIEEGVQRVRVSGTSEQKPW